MQRGRETRWKKAEKAKRKQKIERNKRKNRRVTKCGSIAGAPRNGPNGCAHRRSWMAVNVPVHPRHAPDMQAMPRAGVHSGHAVYENEGRILGRESCSSRAVAKLCRGRCDAGGQSSGLDAASRAGTPALAAIS